MHLSDPMTLDEMYHAVPPNPNTTHKLPEYLSNRGESKLEAYHNRLANFANSGMRETLSDNLHLAGAARYNLAIRHKRRLLSPLTPKDPNSRRVIPAAWERVLPYFNHSELCHINGVAADVNCQVPFPEAETLPPDNGERFFSEYLTLVKPLFQKYNEFDECLCETCTMTTTVAERAAVSTEVQHLEAQIADATTTAGVLTNPAPPATPTPTTTPTAMTFAAFPTQPMPTFHPNWLAIQPVPMMYVPSPVICCHRYFQWTKTRKGRPPHDLHCHQHVCNSASSVSVGVNMTGSTVAQCGFDWHSNNFTM